MAREDKLWFELGVRDNITKAIENIEGKLTRLQRAMAAAGHEIGDISYKDAYKNVNEYHKAIDKVNYALKRIKAQKLTITDKNSLDELNTIQKKLEKMRRELKGFWREAKNGGINTKDISIGFVRELGLDLAMTQVNRVLGENVARERESTRVKKEHTQSVREQVQANQSLMRSYEDVTNAGKKTNEFMSQFYQQISSYFSYYGIKNFLSSIITIGGQFEVQHVALQNILGDAQEANTLFTQLQGLAVESPKTFMELTSYAKQLSAYQIPAKELFDTTKRLADLSSGLGVDMSRLILAYGQVRSAAVLRGQELRQFTEAGIPLVQALADKFTEMNGKLTTTADVFKLISQRAVPFQMVKDILWDMTDQGGQFYNMQAELADTLYGKWQKLQDQWQITLGKLAGGLSGGALKMFIEAAVFLTKSLGTILPTIGFLMVGKGANRMLESFRGRSARNSGEAQIENLRIAKLKEANRLRREQVMLGRQLNAQEVALVQTKNTLLSRDYAMLAAAGELNDKKVMQLINEGKIHRVTLLRLAAESGITREKAKQMTSAELASAAGLLGNAKKTGGIASSLMNFVGGPLGLVLTGAGIITSIWSYFDQKAKELEQKGEAMMSQAQQNANTLSTILNADFSGGATQKNVSDLEESLLRLGSTGEAIVAKSRENMDDIEKRWKTLKEGAESYKKVLDILGGQAGKALFEDMIDDSDIEDALAKYDKIVNNSFKNDAGIERFSEEYKKAIQEVSKGNSKLQKELSGAKTLQEQFDIVGWQRLNRYFYDSKPAGGRVSEALEPLQHYFRLQTEISDKWGEITEKNIPRMVDALRAMAKRENITDAEGYESLTRSVVSALQNGGKEGREKLAEELARQAFNITIIGKVKPEETNLSPLAEYIWKRFGGGVSKDGTISIAGNKYKKAQVANRFRDITDYVDSANKQAETDKRAAELLEKLDGEGELAKIARETSNLSIAELKELNLYEPKGKKGGKSTDEQLKAWKEEFAELKAFYSEYKKWAKLIGKDAALAKLQEDGIFASMFGGDGKLIYDITDWSKALNKFRSNIKTNTTDRRKFGIDVDKEKLSFDFDIRKEAIDIELKELQEYITKQTQGWNLYKTLFEKTGNRDFALNAFRNGAVWDDLSREMADELRVRMEEARVGGFTGIFDLNGTAAEKMLESVNGGYELWKKVTDLVHNNYTKELNDIAAATEKLMTTEDKMLKVEREMAELRSKGATSNDPRILIKEQELRKYSSELFENSEDYLRFYSAILSMTVGEAERVGLSIKKNLVDQLAKGTINADKYLKSIKNVDQQLAKSRSGVGNGRFFAPGLEERMQQTSQAATDNFAAKAIAVQKAEEELQKVRKTGSEHEITVARMRLLISKMELESAQKRAILSEKQVENLKNFSKDISTAVDIIRGMKEAMDSWQELAVAVDGEEMKIDAWFEDSMTAIDAIGQSLNGILTSAMSGSYSGVIKNFVGLLTSPITGIAKNHDARREREIQKSIRTVKKLTTAYNNLEKAIDSALGGIYTSGGYNNMYENMRRQREELQRQYELEDDKKNKDKDKILDYQQQLKEMDETINNFAIDMAKSLYDIDVKSWASELGNALFNAWKKGEDGAEAFKEKVRDIISDITQNIVVKKVIETALSPLEGIITKEMDRTEGKLDEHSVLRIATALGELGSTLPDTVGKTFDAIDLGMQQAGLGSLKDESSSSVKSSIKGMSEETADLLASYINAIRADVSVNRITLTQIQYAIEEQRDLPVIARAQLRELEQITANTSRNADFVERIHSILHSNVLGSNKFNVN